MAPRLEVDAGASVQHIQHIDVAHRESPSHQCGRQEEGRERRRALGAEGADPHLFGLAVCDIVAMPAREAARQVQVRPPCRPIAGARETRGVDEGFGQHHGGPSIACQSVASRRVVRASVSEARRGICSPCVFWPDLATESSKGWPTFLKKSGHAESARMFLGARRTPVGVRPYTTGGLRSSRKGRA